VNGAWTMDGSYILRVQNFSDLPNAPADDCCFAFVRSTEKLYRSKSGAWVEFTAGAGSSNLDSLTDVTVATPTNGQHLVYDSASGQWKNTTPPAAIPKIAGGHLAVDLGSQTTGGTYDLCKVELVAVTYPTQLMLWAVGEWGFGTGEGAYGYFDFFRYFDGGVYASPSLRAPGAQWARMSHVWAWNVNPGTIPSTKLRFWAQDFKGGNCYIRGYLNWQLLPL